jgi:hypothetical protein
VIVYTNRHPTKCINDLPRQDWSLFISHYKQIMSAVHKVVDNVDLSRITQASVNSPDVLWVRNSKQHYDWIFDCLCQLLVLERKYGKLITEERDRNNQRENDTALIMALMRAPHNLLNHGWAVPYSPDQKPYKKDAIDTHKTHLLGLWNSCESFCTWPQGKPDWLDWNEEQSNTPHLASIGIYIMG